ncbi:hypothetical protein GCM10027056_11670 [Glaciibacter psychrotolerans]
MQVARVRNDQRFERAVGERILQKIAAVFGPQRVSHSGWQPQPGGARRKERDPGRTGRRVGAEPGTNVRPSLDKPCSDRSRTSGPGRSRPKLSRG